MARSSHRHLGADSGRPRITMEPGATFAIVSSSGRSGAYRYPLIISVTLNAATVLLVKHS
jgi:hypothetical protein